MFAQHSFNKSLIFFSLFLQEEDVERSHDLQGSHDMGGGGEVHRAPRRDLRHQPRRKVRLCRCTKFILKNRYFMSELCILVD